LLDKYKRITFLDWETTFQIPEKGKKDPSPCDPRNYLVSYGLDYTNLEDNTKDQAIYRCIKHNHKEPDPYAYIQLQTFLEHTDLLVAFNAKFELMWMKACGLKYEGHILDPMIMGYVLSRGQKHQVSLKELCIRYGAEHKKSDLVDQFLKDNIGFEEIPWDIVEEYGRADVVSTKSLFYILIEELNKAPHLWPTVNLMCEFTKTLVDIELTGIKIDVTELDRLEEEYTKELNQLKADLQIIIKDVMGNTPINLDSPEHLSQVLFSRRVIDKNAWKEVFNIGTELRGSVSKPKRRPRISIQEFVKNIKLYTEIVYKTVSEKCTNCNGSGFIQKVKKDGQLYRKTSKCNSCLGVGVCHIQTNKIGGFKFIPKDSSEVAIGGFTTAGSTIERLEGIATGSAREFLAKINRSNSISTYLSTFIGGIRKGLRQHDILHPSFMQCVTATGRLSSRNPNFQNQPRTNTFPVRKCIISRFGPEGLILSGDAKQLEFRIAGELSGDKQIFKDVIAGIDVHATTAKWTGFNRQDSKSYTFAPVYGATDKGKPDNIAKYFRYFQSHYSGLFAAHKSWQDQVLETGSFILPSGREFIYPGTQRYNSGGVSNSTTIANYPVQSFATADLMIIFCLNTWKLYNKYNLKSLVILEVHDDVSCDVYPGELDIAVELMVEAFNSISKECIERYEYELQMSLEIELKVGHSWLDQKELII
jgi:DNA polymerase-1